MLEWAGLGSNQRPLPYQRSALPPEPPARQLRDKESNLGLHVQSVASFLLDDPGTAREGAQRFAPRLSVDEGDVPHRACALLGVHEHAVPSGEVGRRVPG